MHKPGFDPGLTQQFTGVLRRAIERDGNFNVRRRGGSWRDVHPYLALINMKWPAFLGLVVLTCLLVNLVFAAAYFTLGPGQLQGADAPDVWGRFLNAFFFSTHTFTTVGYGSISPKGTAANALAALEALVGLFALAVATSLLYGRVSRPSARIAFSEKMVMAPYQEGVSLQFRIVNRRANNLMDLEARVMLMTVEGPPGAMKRVYKILKLERPSVIFFPLTWTVVHPIDHESPFRDMTPADLERSQAEVLILMRGFDDTFSQTVHARYSYRYDEIIWDARFAPAFEIDGDGDMNLYLDRVGAIKEVS